MSDIKQSGFSKLLYPQQFFVKVFPETKNFAIARAISIGLIWILFFIIIVSVVIAAGYRLQRIDPLFIYYKTADSKWGIVEDANEKKKLSWKDFQMELELRAFINNRYSISKSVVENNSNWCDGGNSGVSCEEPVFTEGRCFLYCEMEHELFDEFTKLVVPDYENKSLNGIVQFVKPGSIQLKAVSRNIGTATKKLLSFGFMKQNENFQSSSIWTGNFILVENDIEQKNRTEKKVIFYAKMEQNEDNSIDFKVSKFFDYLDEGEFWECEN